jgi:hypothetical protein
VEARGVEPLSENLSAKLSPGAYCLYKFPSAVTDSRVSGFGSHLVRDGVNGENAVHVHRCMTPVSEPRYSPADGSRVATS